METEGIMNCNISLYTKGMKTTLRVSCSKFTETPVEARFDGFMAAVGTFSSGCALLQKLRKDMKRKKMKHREEERKKGRREHAML
jgi:hypothetical protein